MKIKLAVLDTDEQYILRMSRFMVEDFADKIELHAFTNAGDLLEQLPTLRPHVLLASIATEFDFSALGKWKDSIGHAYLAPSADIEEYNGVRAIPQYGRLDDIFHTVLQLFADVTKNMRVRIGSVTKSNTVLFTSSAGGVGTSTVAVAFSKSMALRGAKVLYINLETYGDTNLYFTSEGLSTFSDVVYAVKRKRTNLGVVLDSIVRTDNETGVYYYATARLAEHVLELTDEERTEIIDTAMSYGDWDYVVFDASFNLSPSFSHLLTNVGQIVFVGDGHPISNAKIIRAYQVLDAIDRNNSSQLLLKLGIFYNRFSSKNSHKLTELNIAELGGINRLEGGTDKEIVDSVLNSDRFDKIIEQVW
jgi:cellulose biosynthesis protein BcsQ